MNNYRSRLEAEKVHLLSMLNNAHKHLTASERNRGARRIREILDQLAEMDNGENWTQDQGDTRGRIVLNEVQSSRKVFRS